MNSSIIEFDIVIVGAGPSGLSAACRLMQQSNRHKQQIKICILEKGSEVGANIISGAIFDPCALTELFPDWQLRSAPINIPVNDEEIYWLPDSNKAIRITQKIMPNVLLNYGNYIISTSNFCRWLAKQAENLGVNIFTGFAAQQIDFDENGYISSIITGDMGVTKYGIKKENFVPGFILKPGFCTIIAEGSIGNLGKKIIKRFTLNIDKDAQHYALGVKEIWEVNKEQYYPGKVIHTIGWPLIDDTHGGAFIYHADKQQVIVGLIIDLNYTNPYISVFEEFQIIKQHPLFKRYLLNGKRISYGARSITKGGYNSLPKMNFPGGILIGCDAGTLDFSKIKGIHTAMKSGMLAAESIYEDLNNKKKKYDINFTRYLNKSWLYQDIKKSINLIYTLHRWCILIFSIFNIVNNRLLPYYQYIQNTKYIKKKIYPKHDSVISFDKNSSIFISNLKHDDNQPCNLHIKDLNIPVHINLPIFAEPAKRYCPAGVYKIIKIDNKLLLKINSGNCIHCKTCDIKDQQQNINWMPPEGSSGPNYNNM